MEVLSRSYVQAEVALTREDPCCAGGVDQSPWHALVVVPLYCPPRESISGPGSRPRKLQPRGGLVISATQAVSQMAELFLPRHPPSTSPRMNPWEHFN